MTEWRVKNPDLLASSNKYKQWNRLIRHFKDNKTLQR